MLYGNGHIWAKNKYTISLDQTYQVSVWPQIPDSKTPLASRLHAWEACINKNKEEKKEISASKILAISKFDHGLFANCTQSSTLHSHMTGVGSYLPFGSILVVPGPIQGIQIVNTEARRNRNKGMDLGPSWWDPSRLLYIYHSYVMFHELVKFHARKDFLNRLTLILVTANLMGRWVRIYNWYQSLHRS